MSIFSEAMAEALGQLIDAQEQEFNYDGIAYLGFRSSIANGLEMIDAGWKPQEDFTLSVLKIKPAFRSNAKRYILPNKPEQEEEITIAGTVFTIGRVDENGARYMLHLRKKIC